VGRNAALHVRQRRRRKLSISIRHGPAAHRIAPAGGLLRRAPRITFPFAARVGRCPRLPRRSGPAASQSTNHEGVILENSTATLETKRSALIRTGQAILDRAIRENRALRPAEDVDLGGVEQKIADIDRTLGRVNVFNRNEGQPGATFIRCVRYLAGGHGGLDGAAKVASGQRDMDAVRALSASVAVSGGFAVPQGYSGEVIEALRPLVAVRKLGPVIVPAPNGNLTWPKINSGATVGYVPEGSVPITQPAFVGLNLMARKTAAMVPVSNTWIRSASPAGDFIIKQDLIAAVAAAEDAAFLKGTGGANAPTGIRNWAPASNLIASTGASIAQIEADLTSAEYALTGASVLMTRPGWVLSPRTAAALRSLRNATNSVRIFPEMLKGELKGYPFAVSANQTISATGTTEILLADFGEIVLAEYGLILDAASAGGTYTDAQSNVIQAFQADQTLIRVASMADIGVRHQSAVAVITGVTY